MSISKVNIICTIILIFSDMNNIIIANHISNEVVVLLDADIKLIVLVAGVFVVTWRWTT